MTDAISSVGSRNENDIRIHLDQLKSIEDEKEQGNQQDGNTIQRSENGSDTVRITKDANVLVESGLDGDNSVVQKNVDIIEYNLKFDTGEPTEFRIKGTYNTGKEELRISASFNTVHPIKIDGETQNRTLNSRLKVVLGNFTPESFARIEQSGNGVRQIIEGILTSLQAVAMNRQYPPTSVVIKIDGIAELVSNPSSGGVFRHISRGMLALNNSLSRALSGQKTHLQESRVVPKDLADRGESLEVSDFSYQLTDVTNQAPKLSGQEIVPPRITTNTGGATPSSGPTGATGDSGLRVAPIASGTGGAKTNTGTGRPAVGPGSGTGDSGGGSFTSRTSL